MAPGARNKNIWLVFPISRFSPTEHPWTGLTGSVKAEPGTITESCSNVRDAWGALPQEICENLVSSVTNRIQGAHYKGGCYTKYKL